MQANQSVLEEEEEEEDEEDRDGTGPSGQDIELGHARRSSLFQSSTKSHGKRRVSWGGGGGGGGTGTSESNVLRPNIRQEDARHEHDSSDDEVPQDYMIEAPKPASRNPAATSPSMDAAGRERRDTRSRPLYTSSRKQSAPVLPTNSKDVHMSIPPRPSELDMDQASQSEPLHEERHRPMRGLDDHEKALWNWVNVYNLDAFLQDAYYYYEGKGIYSIALSRGLNLLLVIPISHTAAIYRNEIVDEPFFVFCF